MKKLIAILLAALILTIPALAAAPEVERVEYEGNGFIEIDFRNDVSYENLAVAVRDFAGTDYAVTVFERDDDDLTFRADGLQPGETYEITVSGVRSGYSGTFETITQQITLPEAGVPAIQTIDYDRGDRELDIEFMENVDFSGVQVEVTDLNGTVYATRVIESDEDSLEVLVEGLTPGDTYLAKVVGVSLRGLNDYQTSSLEFVARDD